MGGGRIVRDTAASSGRKDTDLISSVIELGGF